MNIKILMGMSSYFLSTLPLFVIFEFAEVYTTLMWYRSCADMEYRQGKSIGGKAIRSHLYSLFSTLRGTGLARVPYFYSIGKLTTRSDFHRTVN